MLRTNGSMCAMQTFRRLSIAVLVLATAATAGDARAASRYASLLATTAGQDTLRNIALFEDQRVTGDGKLFDYLAEGSPLVKLRVVEAIGRIQDPSDAPRLIPLLAGEDRAVAREAIFALGQLGDSTAVDPLIKARAGVPDETRLIAEALGKLGGRAAIEALVDMLHDFSGGVRAEAALALSRCKDPAAANALLIGVYDPDVTVARNSIYSLEKQEVFPRTCDAVQSFLENSDAALRNNG